MNRVDRLAAAAALVQATEQAIEAAEMVMALGPGEASYIIDWGRVYPREERRAFRARMLQFCPDLGLVWGFRNRHVAVVGPVEQVAKVRRAHRSSQGWPMGPMGPQGEA